MPAMTQEESKVLNRVLFEKLSSKDPALDKQAVDAVNEFTRTTLREAGFLRKILPPIPISDDELDRRVDTSNPVKVVDREPGSPAALSLGFAELPMNLYLRADRYEVRFQRIMTPRFTKDVSELRTFYMDLRQVISDNAIKDMQAEEDGTLLRGVNTAIVGPGAVVPTSGTVQYEVINGSITRDSWADSLKVLPNTPSNLEARVVLMNNITVKELFKWQRNEVGGDIAQDIFKNGWSLKNFFGTDVIVTIKKGLVATNTTYHFADPSFIGKLYVLEDTTMYIRREAFFIEFFAYEELGGALQATPADILPQ